ncbi:hypothetical protein M3Y97_01050800 [Aphelenchoides bicaudatus]|nr:hypothetical protein M3Y97_01050800 [Aphelenchoides bicaudatus]
MGIINFTRRACARPEVFKYNVRYYFFPSTIIKPNYDRPFNFSNYNKFVLLEDVNDGGRYGNIFFRVASLYGIGKQLERVACLDRTFNDKFRSEFRSVFPNLHNYVLLDNCWTNNARVVKFPNMIWNYIDVEKLEKYDYHHHIRLYTGVLECHMFFHKFRPEISKMFEFSRAFEQKIDKLADRIFDDDKLPKICAHIRRTDFFHDRHPLIPSEQPFTVKALSYLVRKVTRERDLDKVSLLLLNDDVGFTNIVADEVKDENKRVKKVFIPQNLQPIEDMGLAIKHCDYFVLTSSGSTFGWWIAYLLPDEKQRNVYYRSLFFKRHLAYVLEWFNEAEFVPPLWNRLVHDTEHDRVFVQNRSIYPNLVN